MDDRFIGRLKEKLQDTLPGIEAQYKMAHVVRRLYEPPPPTAKRAGVLALFYPKARKWHIVLIERSASHPADRHGGQISFPGGKYEESDGTLAVTALREAQEEVNIDPRKVELAGPLTELYIPVSNFLVSPYVGFTASTPEFRPQAHEVRSILEVPFDMLQRSETRQETDLRISEGITLRDVPYFNVFGKVVWGATAMILSELLEAAGGSESSLLL
ncbi:MAG: CoA pyrophosphatase [Phaeodactylibacter sp.]|nr:CoA pyrophosphatase [Phaeodactylibacter sp.]MCB9275027.1 CoA pyrophosphatase [Lewinellaceae bacterium]